MKNVTTIKMKCTMRYSKFLNQLMNFLLEYNIYRNVVTQSEFRIYSEIFRVKNKSSMKYIQKRINEMEFIINKKDKPYYIKVVQQYIRKTDI